SVFEPARPYLESCLLGQKAPDQRRSILPWLILAAVLAAVGALVFFYVRNLWRWDAYIEALRQRPGIAITHVERGGWGGTITGLKDPKAADPSSILPDFGLDAAQVHYEWQPYLSLNTPFAADRELDADVAHIQAQIVRFDVGSSRLPLSEAGRIEELVAAI